MVKVWQTKGVQERANNAEGVLQKAVDWSIKTNNLVPISEHDVNMNIWN